VKLSYSKVSSYQTCPLKYKLVYVDRVPTKRSANLVLGGAVHDALAFLHSPGALMIPSLEEVVARFSQEFAKAGQESGLEGTKADAMHNEGVRILAEYYDRGAETARNKRTLGVELRFQFPLDAHHVEGYIDRLDVEDAGGLHVIDYKTGKAHTQPQANDDLQMACYSMGVAQMYPGRPVTCTLLYVSVAAGFPLSKTWSEDELEEKRWHIRDVAAGIEAEQFEAKVDRHCDWCDVRGVCPMWTAPPAPQDIADVAAEYARLNEQMHELDSRKDELKEHLISYAEEHGARYPAGDFWVYCRQTERKEYEPDALREVLAPLGLWDKVTKVEKKRVDDLLDSGFLTEEQKRQVTRLLGVKSASWLVNVKAREGEEEAEGPAG
jgi:RecB family exonuclease